MLVSTGTRRAAIRGVVCKKYRTVNLFANRISMTFEVIKAAIKSLSKYDRARLSEVLWTLVDEHQRRIDERLELQSAERLRKIFDSETPGDR